MSTADLDGDDDRCACDLGGAPCSPEQSRACYRRMLLRIDGARELARQAAKQEEEVIERYRETVRQIMAQLLAEPERELHRRRLQQLLVCWPHARVEVSSCAPMKTAEPLVARGGRFFSRNGETWEW